MVKFIPLTFLAYLAIDFAVYWLGNSKNLTLFEILIHHLKMLPIYLVANVLLTIGFIAGAEKGLSPILLFSISIAIWIISLIIVSAVLYKTIPNLVSALGFVCIFFGIVLIQIGIKH